MPHKLKSSLRRQKRASCSYILIPNGLSNNNRIDHHFDDYQRIEEVT